VAKQAALGRLLSRAGWREVDELLADDSHLLAIYVVTGESAYLVIGDRPGPA
jgi:hypothetical protein